MKYAHLSIIVNLTFDIPDRYGKVIETSYPEFYRM